MVTRLIGGTLAAVLLGGIAVVAAFQGYQRFLRWLVAGTGQSRPQAEAGSGTTAGPRG